MEHAGLLSRSPLVTKRLRALTWLFYHLMHGLGSAKDVIAEAFDALFGELQGNSSAGGQPATLSSLLEQDVATLFWGADRLSLGRSETGAVRGSGASVFSIS